MRQTDDIKELCAALAAAQGEYPPVLKTSENPFFKSKYADLAACVEAAQSVNAKNGLAVTQWACQINGQLSLTTRLLHSSGQWMEDDLPLFLGKHDVQSLGSALTYTRRYAYCSILGLAADDDDDGNAATKSAESGSDAFDASPRSQSDHVDPAALVVRKGKLKALQRATLNEWCEAQGMPDHPARQSPDQREQFVVAITAVEAGEPLTAAQPQSPEWGPDEEPF